MSGTHGAFHAVAVEDEEAGGADAADALVESVSGLALAVSLGVGDLVDPAGDHAHA